MTWEPSARTGSEVKAYLRYDATDLLEIQDVSYEVDRKGRVGGAGLGHPKHTYHKFGVPEGTWSISKSYLNEAVQCAQSDLFAKLVAGTTAVQTESFASGAASMTTTYQPTGILTVVITGGGDCETLVEGTGFTVNYITKTITFVGNASNSGKVIYTSNAAALLDDDALDGDNHPLIFDVEWREKDGTVIKRLVGCAPYTHGIKSGGIGEEPFTEDLSGQFLYLETSP